MNFTIKIEMNDDREFYLRDLDEKRAMEILANAYDDIFSLKKRIKFTDDLSVDAFDLQYFHILIH